MPKALIIEDTPDNMALITFIFNKNGIETMEAETGRKGIDMALAAPRPDFIILDIQLPDMSGNEVLKAIRSSETDDSIPIIAMTSYAMSGDREELLAAGCTGYIEKPIDPMTVMEEIGEILRGKVAE
ncbi:MAG: two-component system response regulator [Deltaproteobacteria bacterium RIFOXYD12_FULL_57_12]|nr:MAG: two-component system response regulator [Deltaproteobacteria bacterium RIFOXYD12_FULL_57_12]